MDNEKASTEQELNAPQPPPAGGTQPVWDLVISDMKERDSMGVRKYGTRLLAHNGRDALVDAYQEALDLAVYLRQAITERGGSSVQVVDSDELERGLRRIIGGGCAKPDCTCCQQDIAWAAEAISSAGLLR